MGTTLKKAMAIAIILRNSLVDLLKQTADFALMQNTWED